MSVLKSIAVPAMWSEGFARVLGAYFRDLRQIVNGGVRLTDQIGTVKEAVRWNSDYGTIKVGPFARPVRWLLVLSARPRTAPSAGVSGCPVTWTMEGDQLVISAVSGLSSSTDYLLDLWALEG